MKIELDKRNEILKRHEVRIVESYDSNPGKANAVKTVSSHFGKADDCIYINKIESKFGSNEFVIDALVFDDPKLKIAFETRMKSRKERKGKK